MARSRYRYVSINRDEVITAALKDFKNFNEDKQKKIRESIVETTELVAKSAKSRIHNVTGNLSRAIETKFVEDKNTGFVNAKAPHAHLVEFGAKSAIVGPNPKGGKKALKIGEKVRKWTIVPQRKPHPFLKPAAEQEKSKLTEKIKEVLK